MTGRRGFLGWTAAGLFPWRSALALEPGKPSATALGTAMHRAAHQLLETPKVFDDPIALPILGAAGRRSLEQNLEGYRSPGARSLRALLVARSRFAEEALAEAFAAGVRQYVVLGAGLDTFACRNPHAGLRVFEVDHPSTQAWKRERLAEPGVTVPASVSFVAVDFETQKLDERLAAAGFRAGEPAFYSWLGVVIYLTREAMSATARTVASGAAGTRLVFDFTPPPSTFNEAERRGHDDLAARVAKLGERWIGYYDPAELAGLLRGCGFSSARTFGAEELNARYFASRADGFRVSGAARMMAAQV